jgi:hypothetical protein
VIVFFSFILTVEFLFAGFTNKHLFNVRLTTLFRVAPVAVNGTASVTAISDREAF